MVTELACVIKGIEEKALKLVKEKAQFAVGTICTIFFRYGRESFSS